MEAGQEKAEKVKAESEEGIKKSSMAALMVAAVGIVYGDIGTSPLYALKAVFTGHHGLILTPQNLVGIVSLILWGFIILVSLKYVTIMLRADNRGEGGALALMTLAHSALPKNRSKLYYPLLMLGVLGACLFYGDGVITPAISILSAVEGLEVATPVVRPYLIPIALGIVVGLYSFQSKGTEGIGRFFGPLMLIWFGTLAVLGIINIYLCPEILKAINPWYAICFVYENPFTSFIALSAIVMAFTGSEALYADMGHFGPTPIRLAWFRIVFPALVLNYMGQGGLLLRNPSALSNPFFKQLDSWSIYPLVFISTIAVVIASQATISGTFSITKQAIGLGLLPRMKVVHTSESEMGQIYIPLVNWLQLAAVVMAVVTFKSSENLTGAYGIAVTGSMFFTTIFLFFIMRYKWKQNLFFSIGLPLFFGVFDFALLSSCSLKIGSGGWFPIVLGFGIYAVMLTWRRGRIVVGTNLRKHAIDLRSFLDSLFLFPPQRVSGISIFLRGENEGVPPALLHNLSHNKVLHDRVYFLTVHTHEESWVPLEERVAITDMGHGCYQIDLHYGFKDEVDIPKTLMLCRGFGHQFDLLQTSFFISKQTLISTPANSGMSRWREYLFIWIYRNARNAADYYQIPANRVIELGGRLEI